MLTSLTKLEALAVTILSTIGILLDDIPFDGVGLNSRCVLTPTVITRNTIRTSGLTPVLCLPVAGITEAIVPTLVVSSTVSPISF